MLDDIYNFRAVDDRLATSGQPTETQLREVAAQGFEVVINLALHDDPRYSLPDETALVKGLDMQYVHIPIPFDAPQTEHLMRFIDAMRAAEGRKVFLHCAANMRATAFLSLYLHNERNLPQSEAFKTMQSLWEPDEVWRRFINSHLEPGAQ